MSELNSVKDTSLNQKTEVQRRIKINRQSWDKFQSGQFSRPKRNEKYAHKPAETTLSVTVDCEKNQPTTTEIKNGLQDEVKDHQVELLPKKKTVEETTRRRENREKLLSRKRTTCMRNLKNVHKDAPQLKRARLELEKETDVITKSLAVSDVPGCLSDERVPVERSDLIPCTCDEMERRGRKRRLNTDKQDCPIPFKRAQLEPPVLQWIA
ncbi:uncharacterized protein LOC111191796 [Astyanax mexicanus]|uniref:uncharacterized protein LOC111191796 n=1 Tax=Astyanax mexicanus TaxID=7994 RepID=UPI0020CB54B4|nr:uncharacterized protein LOC111191796 [Astyanax mexicanus]